jgi:3-polyprenyl-4-hydroxybenzoate decarboxylase
LLTDKQQDLKDFKSLFEHILARVDWQRDFFIFGQTAFDTLDYASGKFNQGSKAILMGLGDAKRELHREFNGELPAGVRRAKPFCGGCLVLEAAAYADQPGLAEQIAESAIFDDWQMVVLHDDITYADTTEKFLWATWTRCDPARDTHARGSVENNHIGYQPPIVIDARMKPWYPKEVEPHPDTVKLVDERWSEYFRS